MKDLSDNDNGLVNIQRGAKNVIEIVGQIASSVAEDARITAAINLPERAQKPSVSVYIFLRILKFFVATLFHSVIPKSVLGKDRSPSVQGNDENG